MDRPAPEAAAPETRGVRQIFALPQFRWLFAGNVSFFLAMGSQGVVRQALAYHLTGSNAKLGLLATLSALPMAALAPLGGGLADRADRRKVMMAGQAVVFAAELAMLALLVTGRLRFAHLLLLSFAMGGVFPFVMPSRQAIVANLVGRERLAQAMALTITGINTARVLGPWLGSRISESFGRTAAYAVGTALYGVAIACTFRIAPSRADRAQVTGTMWGSVAEGARFLRGTPLVVTLIAFGLVPLLLAMPVQSFFVAFSERWGHGDAGLGTLSAAVGVGGILGSLVVVWIGDAHGRTRRQLVAVSAFALGLAGFAAASGFWQATGLLLLAMASTSIFQTLNNTAIHLLIPDRVRGRVSSFLLMSMSLPMLGGYPLGVAADRFGLKPTFVAASLLSMAIAWAFVALSSRLRRLDESVREALAAPAA